MFRLLVVAVLLSSVCLRAQTPSPEPVLQHAVELQQAGDLEGAVRGYREFLVLRPKEVAVRSNLGVLLSRLGQYEQAIAEYKKARDLDPNNAGIVLNLGLAYYKSGRIAEAARTFEQARQADRGNLQTMLLLADCHLRLGQNRDVITLLQPVEQEDSGNLAIAYLLGMAFIRDGKVEEGQTRVDKILRNGDSAEARFLLGNQMFSAGDFPAAVKQFVGAIALGPNLPGLQALYGQALLNTGDPDAAGEAFQKELAADPNNFEANFYLAQILIERKEFQKADPIVGRVASLRPDSLPVALEEADLDIGENKLQSARQNLQKAEQMWPQAQGVHQRLFDIYQKLHLAAEAQGERKKLEVHERKETDRQRLGAGDPAPELRVTRKDSGELATLRSLRGSGPVLLVFGSYTCPNFRSAAATLNRLYPEYKDQIPFYLVYIREAHTTATWDSTRNQREGIALPGASNMAEQHDHAAMCVRKLRIEFPALLDSMDGAAEKAYQAWPSRATLVDRQGRIIFNTGLSEQDFHPEQFEAALRKASASTAARVATPAGRPR